MIRIVAIYPNTADSRFDGDYYVDRHAPFARGLLEPHGLLDLSSSLGLAALDGTAPPYWAISEMAFPSRETFDTAMAACGAALFADIPNYTNVTPVLQTCRTAI